MQMNFSPGFGLLPEPERNITSFLTSSAINGAILGVLFIVGMTARHVIQQQYEQTELIVPSQPPPPIKVKPPVLPKMPPPPQTPKLQMEAPKIQVQQPKPPEPKPVQMEAKVALPTVKAAKPQIILAPQPKAALTAAMPAQNPQVHPSTRPVHFGDTFGVTPNPNASRPATVAAIGNPYGGNQGPAVAPHGVVGSTGIGNGTHYGSNAGTVGRVASAGIPGATGTSNSGSYGRVASAGIPAATAAPVMRQQQAQVQSTSLEVISKPPVQYTSEARALHVEGDVILRVTFMASGQVVVHGIVHGLGHGLDEEARRVAEQIRFRPATKDGHPVDLTTNITISFQLA
jgi:TonB family protein